MIDSNQHFIIAAYAVTWGVMLGYLIHLARKGGRVAAEHGRVMHASTGDEGR